MAGRSKIRRSASDVTGHRTRVREYGPRRTRGPPRQRARRFKQDIWQDAPSVWRL